MMVTHALAICILRLLHFGFFFSFPFCMFNVTYFVYYLILVPIPSRKLLIGSVYRFQNHFSNLDNEFQWTKHRRSVFQNKAHSNNNNTNDQ